MQQVAVVIPVYKPALSHNEQISLQQCLAVLGSHPIIFVGPQSLDTSVYRQFCADIPFDYKSFDDRYFKDINGYNELMLSKLFYNQFTSYKYILIHQLDAYVFKDELLYWCNQGYDFIGAPQTSHANQSGEQSFLKGYSKYLKLINMIFKTSLVVKNVGNGGFSLRRVKSCNTVLGLMKSKVKQWGSLNEDGFFKYVFNLLWPFFRLPSEQLALKFAVEIEPDAALTAMDGALPFGCHAFAKYQPEFWQKHIPGIKSELADAH